MRVTESVRICFEVSTVVFKLDITESVQIRSLQERDAEEFFELVQANIYRLSKWCPWLEEVDTIEKTVQYLRGKIERYQTGDGLSCGFFDNGRLVGFIALEYVDKRNLVTEIGYWLDEKVEGRGLVTAACVNLIGYSFEHLRLERVQIRCAVENVRSRAIPEKLGFKIEGILRRSERLRDRTVDLAVYGMLRSEWIWLSHRRAA